MVLALGQGTQVMCLPSQLVHALGQCAEVKCQPSLFSNVITSSRLYPIGVKVVLTALASMALHQLCLYLTGVEVVQVAELYFILTALLSMA